MTAVLQARRLIQTFREARKSQSILSRIRQYRNYLSIAIETDEFIVRTVEHHADLLRVLQLRHEIFIEEWQGRRESHGLDVDSFDDKADHLVIIEKRTGQMIGTYRLLCSRFVDEFYSSTEFDLQVLTRAPYVLLELGRACIRSSHRNGTTIDLLWKGLARYANIAHATHLFGCSSVKSTDPQFMSNLFAEFAANDQWSDDYHVRPLEHHMLPGYALEKGQPLSPVERRAAVPPLLRSYLHAGAKVHGAPAYDREFQCCDLLTILDLSQIEGKFKARYF